MIRPWLVVLIALCGCAKIDRLTLSTFDWSPELTHLVVLSLGSDAKLAGASGLIPREDTVEVAFERSSDATGLAIYGYRPAQVSILSPPTEAELRRAPLVARRAGDPRFPDPDEILAFDADGTPRTGIDPPIELTASWLPRCAALAHSGTRADIRCSGCAADVSQDGCGLAIAPSNCTLGGSAVIGLESVAFDVSASFGTCTISSSDERTALECAEAPGGCVIELHESSAPAVEVVTRRLVVGEFASNRERMGLESAPFGYLHDLLPIDGGVWVAEPGGGPTDWRCPQRIGPSMPGTLHRLAGPQLEPVFTATTPPCLLRLLPGVGDRILAFADVEPQRLIELELDGTSVRSFSFTEADAAGMLIADVLSFEEEIGVLFVGPDPTARTVLRILDRRTLAQSRSPLLLHPRARLLFVAGPGRIGVVIPDDNAVVVANIVDTTAGAYSKLDCFNLGLTGISAVATRGDETWLASRLPAARAFVARGLDLDCDAVAAWERDVQLDGVALDPDRPRGFVGASTTDPAETAYLFRLDTAASKVLGGSVEVGRGPLARLRLRGDVLFGILPATGEVIRAEVP